MPFVEVVEEVGHVVPPWEVCPYSLVSWWDMQEFSAVVFWNIGVLIGRLQKDFSKRNPGQKFEALKDEHPAIDVHQSIVKRCAEIGLKVSSKCGESIVRELKEGYTSGEFSKDLEQLENTIRWEMEDKLFMYIPPDRAERYDEPELLGTAVSAKFPAIQYDIVEAGNCFACGRSTATVFHLMRIMEVGLQAFGTKLGVPLVDEKVWQVILDGINAAIKKLPPKDAATVELSQMAANLYSVKLAWRNEVMHPKETYTLEEADNLIRQVKIFMEQLVKVV